MPYREAIRRPPLGGCRLLTRAVPQVLCRQSPLQNRDREGVVRRLYFQDSMAFFCNDSGVYSSSSRRMPLGSVMLVSGALLLPARASSTLTPRLRNAATV